MPAKAGGIGLNKGNIGRCPVVMVKDLNVDGIDMINVMLCSG